MGKLHVYTYKNENGTEVSLRLTEEDAKKRGLTDKAKRGRSVPDAQPSEGTDPLAPAGSKSRTPANKAVSSPQNKGKA